MLVSTVSHSLLSSLAHTLSSLIQMRGECDADQLWGLAGMIYVDGDDVNDEDDGEGDDEGDGDI